MSILINGSPAGYLTCSRGVRQGDPFSPLLFCVAGEVPIYWPLSSAGSLQAFVSVRGLPFPSYYLLYADDILLFCAASISNAKEILKILKDYAEILGQFHNPDKTSRRSSLALDSLIGISFIVYNVGYKNQITYLPQHLSHQRHHLLVERFLLLLKFSIT